MTLKCGKSDIGLPFWLSGKESACKAGDAGFIPGLGGSPEEGNGSPLQYSCLENPMDRGAWLSMGSQKSWTRLSNLITTTTIWLFLVGYTSKDKKL